MLAFTLLAFGLLVAGVVGSLLPTLPGPLLSLAGVYTYWWASGFTAPSTLLVAVVTALVLLTVVGGLFEDVIAARLGGASGWSATAAGLVGFVCFFALGPVGMLLGSATTVFVLEYRRQRDAKAGATAATAVVLATIGSTLVQLLVTSTLLVAMALVVLL
ncbi:DUF456 family protein [Halovenus sp. WSH3]|uniref:DUF456 family protein n=1 Tax=Halovenus carboxidivorans TaxID=2692199 RepID=A0A6B0T399_9EURY|nr:DUF456 domain-containing protein [Halovenus carboxidivorans]MXR51607.1 DUF456 family protein [Halovenus carboxidivorans]